ncbi:unnamed protein product [Ambrosiozyma monospora]|uniref:Unnamed protein product n=1 Tax=Ambrosiozyma monospora TaxID=43982 RepID=A0ACB5T8H8_AMBMO|nr:unnamed protein product [Ambrosiozyma monospora]
MIPFSSLPAEVLQITTSLPLEIQCLIIKQLIHIFIKKFNMSDPYITQLVTLFGYSSSLDDIMAQTFQELVFDEGIFSNPCFNNFAEFVLSRSMTMKRLSIVADNLSFDELDKAAQTVLSFMQSFQIMDVKYICPTEPTLKYLKCATSLTTLIPGVLTINHGGNFEEYYRLVNLKLLEIEINERDINTVTAIIRKWRGFIPSGEIMGQHKKKRSIRLSISLEYFDVANTHINQWLIDLTSVISNNRDILTTSIDIRIDGPYPSPLTADLYLGLINQCDHVTVLSDDMDWDPLNDIECMNKITCVSALDMRIWNNTDFSVVLNLQSLHSLKRLHLIGYYMDAPSWNMIPDTLQSFTYEMVNFTSCTPIKLPSKLKKLRVETEEFPEISNVKDLRSLMEVSIAFIDGSEYCEMEMANQLPLVTHDEFERIQISINRLPSTVTKLRINGYETKQQLLFNNLPVLETLDISFCGFDSSSLISLQSLDVSNFPIEKIEQLPNSLRSLCLEGPIDYAKYGQVVSSSALSDSLETLTISMNGENFTDFWSYLILPLNKLLELDIQNYNPCSDLIIDEYPPYLASLRIVYADGSSRESEKIVFHEFDKTLKYLSVEGYGHYIKLKQGKSNKTLILSGGEPDKPFNKVYHLSDVNYNRVLKEVENVKIVVSGEWRLYT